MEIRRLSDDDDAGRAGRIVQQAYFALDGYPRDPGGYDDTLAAVAERAKDADVMIAVLGGEIVACLTYVADHVNPHAEHGDSEAASFRYFGVDPAAQSRGVGEAMVQWCIDAARAAGRRRLRIHTLTMMNGAQRLYERMGFVRDVDHDEDWDGIVGLAYRFDL